MSGIEPPALTPGQQEVDTRLSKLEETCRQLQLEKLELLRRRNAAAPINTLPDECLSYIFVLAVEEGLARLGADEFPARTSPADFRKVPAVLLSVSARWQALALATPRMWSNLILSLRANRPQHPVFIDALKAHIERTRSVPISIELSIDDPPRSYLDHFTTHSPFCLELDTVALTFHRCRCLRIHMPWNSEYWAAVRRALLTQMPVLEDLALFHGHQPSRKALMPLEVKRLKLLQLSCIDFLYSTPAQVANITTLNLKSSSMRMTEVATAAEDSADSLTWPQPMNQQYDSHVPLSLLQHAAKLKNLTLNNVLISGWEEQPIEDITIGSLTQLEVIRTAPHLEGHDDASSTDQWLSKLFRNIRMPCLRTFTLSGHSLDERRCEIIFASMAQVRLQLEALHLEHVLFNSTATVALLANLPHLTSLTLRSTCATEELFQGLMARDTSNGACCPRLADIVIDHPLRRAPTLPDYRTLTIPTLLEFVKSRKLWSFVSPIHSLTLNQSVIPITEEMWYQFKDNVITIKFNGYSEWTTALLPPTFAVEEPSAGSNLSGEDFPSNDDEVLPVDEYDMGYYDEDEQYSEDESENDGYWPYHLPEITWYHFGPSGESVPS